MLNPDQQPSDLRSCRNGRVPRRSRLETWLHQCQYWFRPRRALEVPVLLMRAPLLAAIISGAGTPSGGVGDLSELAIYRPCCLAGTGNVTLFSDVGHRLAQR